MKKSLPLFPACMLACILSFIWALPQAQAQGCQAVQISLETGNPVHVLKTGEEHKLGLRILDKCEAGHMGELEWTVVKAEPDAVASPAQKVDLVGEGEHFVPLAPPSSFGVYNVTVRYREKTAGQGGHPVRQAIEKKFSYAYMTPAGPTEGFSDLSVGDGFLFGVCAHPWRYDRQQQELEALAASLCGVKALREDVRWEIVQRTPDEWRWDIFDFVIENYAKYGIEVLPIYAYTAKWAVAKDWKPADPSRPYGALPDAENWRTFVQAFTTRYHDKIRFGEIWNEPDLRSFANYSAEEYVRQLEIAYEEIKQIAPHIMVFSGGVSNLPRPSDRANASYNPEVVPAIIHSGQYDIFALHNHGLFTNYQELLERLPSFGNNKPWFANEMGLSSVGRGDDLQAQSLFHKLLYSWAKGALGYNWYELRNSGTDPANTEHGFGLLTHDFYPKPAYVTYNMLAELFSGARFLQEFPQPTDGSACLLFQGRTGDFLIPCWTVERTGEQVLVVSNLASGAKVSLVDLWGNETLVNVTNGTALLSVSARPTTLRIAGQTEVPLVSGSIYRQDGEITSPDGDAKGKFRLELTNPLSRTVSLKVVPHAPVGIRLNPSERTCVLRAGQSAKVEFELQRSSEGGVMGGDNLDVELVFGEVTKQLHFKINQQHRLPAKGFTAHPVFALDNVQQVTPLITAEPANAYLFWQGPEDLSAQIRIGKTGGTELDEALLIEVRVRDDIHVQTRSDSSLWMEDSLHLMLDLEQRSIWDFGLAHFVDPETGESQSVKAILLAPDGFSPNAVVDQITLETSRDEATKMTLYQVRIPFAAIGMNRAIATHGFGFNIQINDNDGKLRESFMSLVPGEMRFRQKAFFPKITFHRER